MGTLIKKKIIYSGSPQYYEMPGPSEDLLGTIVQFVGTSNVNYINGYFYKCIEVVPATDPKTYIWERCDVQPNSSIDAYTKTETDTLLAEKAELSVASISTAGGGTEVHATVSEGGDEVSVNYYKQGAELPDYVNLYVNGDGFSFHTRNSVDNKVPFVATYEQTTYADVTAAIDADRSIVVNFPANRNLICVTYSTYVPSQNVLMYGIFKYQTWVSLATITLTPANEWRVTHTKLQELLESGINIKTVNNQPVLGPGNIDVGGGDVVVLTPDVSTYEEVKAAIEAKRALVVLRYGALSAVTAAKIYSDSVYLAIYGIYFFIRQNDSWEEHVNEPATSDANVYEDKSLVFSYSNDAYGDSSFGFVFPETITGTEPVSEQEYVELFTASPETARTKLASKKYTDAKIGDLSALTTDDKTSLVNAINEVYEKSGEPFRVKNWAASNLNVSIPYCTEEIANTSIAKMTYSIDAEEGASYQIVGMIAYEVFDSSGQRINCWPVCQFTGNGQKELSVRWACMGSSRKTATKINAWVLLKHR